MNTRIWTAITFAVAALAMTCTWVVAEAKGFPLVSVERADAWTSEETAILSSLQLNQLPPEIKDASNAVEDSPAAIELGRRLFFDARFSRNGAVSCASCHDPARQFQDGLPVGQGVGTGSRRAMPIVGAGRGPWLFWDGRKDSLWSQALGPLEDGVEHGSNRLRYAHLLQQHYRPEYESVFKAMPDLSRLPRDASPQGTTTEKAAWQAMDERSRDEVSRVFANMGKAIGAYEATLRHQESRVDLYIESVLVARMKSGDGPARKAAPGLHPAYKELDASEIHGLKLFIGKGQCVTCHTGPLLTDHQFHNTGIAPRDPAKPDRGRAAAIAKVQADEFNCLGRYSDAKPESCAELRFISADDPALEGAFKTPSLRDVALRPPYMHAGQIATLEDVVRHYVKAPHAPVGHSELSHLHSDGKRPGHAERQPIELTESEIQDLVQFMGELSSAGH